MSRVQSAQYQEFLILQANPTAKGLLHKLKFLHEEKPLRRLKNECSQAEFLIKSNKNRGQVLENRTRMGTADHDKINIWYFRYPRGNVESPIVTLNQLGHLLQEIRCQRGLTQRQLGQRAGFAQSAISALESNPASAKLERIFQLLAALDLEIVLRERKNHQAQHEW